jgi:hypothetical protein
MEILKDCTVMMSSQAPGPVTFGPAETNGAYRVLAGTFAADQPAPPFHFHPHTDEAIYVATGEFTCRLGTVRSLSRRAASYSFHEERRTRRGIRVADRCSD